MFNNTYKKCPTSSTKLKSGLNNSEQIQLFWDIVGPILLTKVQNKTCIHQKDELTTVYIVISNVCNEYD